MRQNLLYARSPINPGLFPSVEAVAGFGTGGGAYIDGRGDAAYGDIVCVFGSDYSSPSLELLWSATPPPLFWACDWARLNRSGTNPVTISIVPYKPLQAGVKYSFHYEWTTAL